MEPIGQKTSLTSSEEAIFTTDLEVESGENETEKVFDSTLDQILADEIDYENILDEMLEKDGQDSLISYVHQNQFDSEIGAEKTEVTVSENGLFLPESMKPNFVSEASGTFQSNLVQKSDPIVEEMIELVDPRVVTEENDFVNHEGSGIAETGLQSLLDQTTPDTSNAVLQKFLHQVEHTTDETENSYDLMQTVLKTNSRNEFISEQVDEIPRSSLHTIMHKTSDQTALPEEAILTEESVVPTSNEIKSSINKSISQIVMPEETILTEESVVPTSNEIKSSINKSISQTALPEEVTLTEESVVPTSNEIKSSINKSINQTVLPGETILTEESVVPTSNEIKSSINKSISQTVLPEEAVLAEESVVQTSNEIVSQIKNNLVRQIHNNEDIVSANQKTIGENIKFNNKNEMPKASSLLISENSQNTEITNKNHVKNLVAESSIPKEHLKASESMEVVENIKSHEGSHTKVIINDTEEFAAEAKSRVSDGLQISEKDKSVSEFQSLTRPKVSDITKLTERLKATEDLQGQAKVILSEDLILKEEFKSPDGLKETVKAKEIFQNTVSETTKFTSENLSLTPLKQFRTSASKETKLSGSSNSGIEPVMSPGLSPASETSGTSIYKTSDSVNASTDSLRNLDLPFDIQQLLNRVRIIRSNGVEEMTLRLHPEELGNITLKVRQSGGDLMIDMRVDNPLAKQIVESGFDTLRSRFLDQDFAYKDLALNVDINEKDSQFGRDRQYEEFEDELFASQRGEEQEISTLEEKSLQRHRTDSGLNLYV